MNSTYIMDVNIDDIMRELSKNHKVTNKKTVKKAYEFAAKKHELQKRKTGEPYIMHALRVARFVSSWGFESDVIASALLHDTVEDCNVTIEEIENLFDSNIAEMVDALTSLDKELENIDNLSKEQIDNLSDIKLKEKMTEKALFIKAADRLDNLYTIDGVKDEEKRIKKAIHTREIIIPMLKLEEAYRIIDELEVLCLKIEHPDRYAAINEYYGKLLDSNSITTKKNLDLFKKVFSYENNKMSSELSPYSDYIANFKYNPRSPISVYRQINLVADNINTDIRKFINKKNIAMYDLTLVINDNNDSHNGHDRPSELTPMDIFFKIFEVELMDNGICIVGRYDTTYGDSSYFLLRDELDNLYRLFIKTETEYMRYKLGHIIDADDYNVNPDEDSNTKKIKVFTASGEARYIEAGATMLDFAFMIHTDIGFEFDYALIDNTKTHHTYYERLSEGDTITIKTRPDVKPELKWIKYVKTSKAIDILIRKFEKSKKNAEYDNDSNCITSSSSS